MNLEFRVFESSQELLFFMMFCVSPLLDFACLPLFFLDHLSLLTRCIDVYKSESDNYISFFFSRDI